MLRRQIYCRAYMAPVVPFSVGSSSVTLCTPIRTGFFDSMRQAAQVASASAREATANAKAAAAASAGADGSKAAGAAASSAFPPGVDVQKLKTMADMFATQPPEKQEQMLKQALEMQKMMSKIPGMKHMTKMNTQVLEQLAKQQQQGVPLGVQPPPATDSGSSSNSSGGAKQGTPTLNPFTGSIGGPTAQSPSASSTGSSHRPASGAPTLDDLKKVNLGPEIESLFAELRSIRKVKNDYRDKFHAERTRAESADTALRAAEASEQSLRGKLRRAEQEVMLLTSENMELRDGAKHVKLLTAENGKLRSEVRALKDQMAKGTAAGSPQYAELSGALQAKEEALRSLGRKVERMRRRDPLLHFSLCCNDVMRLCELRANASANGSGGDARDLSAAMRELVAHVNISGRYLADDPAREAAEKRFSELQSAYVAVQQEAWLAAAATTSSTGGGATAVTLSTGALRPHAAAAAYVAALRRFFLAKVPYSNYDALVTVRWSPAAGPAAGAASLKALAASAGLTAERVSAVAGEEERWLLVAPATATTAEMLLRPGPFGYAFALRAATTRLNDANSSEVPALAAVLAGGGSGQLAGQLAAFTLTHAQPHVSKALVQNSGRVAVAYESARSSGPGGQAVNVAETQIKVKLFIDQHPRLDMGSSSSITVDGVSLRVVGDGEGEASNNSSGGGGDESASGGGDRAFAFFAEAQDSRSALQNKTSATQRLLAAERAKYNEGPLRSPFGRCDDLEAVLKRCLLAEAGGVKVESDVVGWCLEAAAAAATTVASATGGGVSVNAADAALVLAFKRWAEEIKA